MNIKQKQSAIADTVTRQLERHGYHLTREEAMDVAAQIVMGHMMSPESEPRCEVDESMWRPSDSDDGGCWDFTECEVTRGA